MPEGDPMITVKALTKRYGPVAAVDSLTFDVRPGSVTGFVADVGEFTEALARVTAGGTALDPEVVSQLLSASRRAASVSDLTGREREVLSLMAEGRSNAAIAASLVVSAGAVEKHVASIFAKLGLPQSETDNRRVLAVLRYLGS
jgi:DNA-binding NarL/FixJ family response regulator